MSGRRKYLLIVASFVVLAVIAACSENQVPTQVPVEFSPTEAVEVESPDIEQEAATVEDETSGDPAAGQALFNSNGCSGCHSTGDDKIVGPGLAGVYERAGSRTSLDADAYIEQSVRSPQAFVVDGFPGVMPSFDSFSDGDMQNLIAFMKTLN